MAIQRFAINGYGQLEINNCAFRRDGRVEAQCKLDETDFATIPAENGMLLTVDNVTRTVKLPEEGDRLIAINYSAEHLYESRLGLKDFKLTPKDFLPRLGYLAVGDKFTTNCLAYDTADFNDDDALTEATEDLEGTPLYGTTCENGAIKVTKTEPSTGVVLVVTKPFTMPDGQFALQFQVLETYKA